MDPFDLDDDDRPTRNAKELAASIEPTSFTLLSDQCLRAALPAADRSGGRPLRMVVLIEVPSEGWIQHVKSAARRYWPNTMVLSPDVRASAGEHEMQLKHIVAGNGLVIVFAPGSAAVAPVIIRTVDRRFSVIAPQRQQYLAIARQLLRGDVAKAFAGIDISGLELDELCVPLVRGSTAKQAAAKLAALVGAKANSRAGEDVPALDEVHGYGQAKDWAKSLVKDIVSYRAGQIDWKALDHGALLFGPPGVGKTLFARIVAEAAKIPFIYGSISEYFAASNGHLDGVIKRQRALFAEAARVAPSLLFIDELDALPARGNGGVNDNYWRPIITDLLLLLDSPVSAREGVVLIGATNRLGDLDPALLRPGRMDRLLHLPPPEPTDLVGILRYHLRGDLEKDDLLPLALSTSGATGADVVTWVKSARRRARSRGRPLTLQDLTIQVLGVDQRPEAIRYRTAVHEVGHVVAALALGMPVRSVTLADTAITHGSAQINLNPHGLMTRDEIEASVIVLLAGRAAEATILGGLSSASGGRTNSDLERATEALRSMHMTMGLGRAIIYRSDTMDDEAREIVESDLQRLYSLAVGIMLTHRDSVTKIVQALLEMTTLDDERLTRLFSNNDQVQ